MRSMEGCEALSRTQLARKQITKLSDLSNIGMTYICMHMEAECNKTTPVIEVCRCLRESVNAVNVTPRYFRIAFEKLANVKIESIEGSAKCAV